PDARQAHQKARSTALVSADRLRVRLRARVAAHAAAVERAAIDRHEPVVGTPWLQLQPQRPEIGVVAELELRALLRLHLVDPATSRAGYELGDAVAARETLHVVLVAVDYQ